MPHATGRGFMWSAADVDYVLALTRHVIKTRNVDKKRVLVWGHSAGGTMTLTTLAKAPALFAGALTSASGTAPGKSHEDKRVFVILGEDDPNYRVVPLVRKHVKRTAKTKGACALLSVEWQEHVLPADDFLDFGFDWVLHGKGRGGEARVGLVAKGRAGPWRHVLVRHKEAKDSGDEPSSRSKKDAIKLLEEVRIAVEGGHAFFPFEAARHSEDTRSASAGGGLSSARLAKLFGEAPDVKPGACSKVLESPKGLHLVMREVDGRRRLVFADWNQEPPKLRRSADREVRHVPQPPTNARECVAVVDVRCPRRERLAHVNRLAVGQNHARTLVLDEDLATKRRGSRPARPAGSHSPRRTSSRLRPGPDELRGCRTTTVLHFEAG